MTDYVLCMRQTKLDTFTDPDEKLRVIWQWVKDEDISLTQFRILIKETITG